MKSVNKVILVGHVTRDPEMKSTSAGKTLCSFGLATSREWKDTAGENHTYAEFHSLIGWNGVAEFCGRHVKKGKPLYVEGYLRTRSWDGASGEKHYRTEVVIDDIVLLGQGLLQVPAH